MVSASPGHERDHDGMASPRQKQEAWWRIHLFRGIVSDIRRRIPYYVSDWTDAWDYRVVPATVYMYFAKSVSPSHLVLPSLHIKLRVALTSHQASSLPWLSLSTCSRKQGQTMASTKFYSPLFLGRLSSLYLLHNRWSLSELRVI